MGEREHKCFGCGAEHLGALWYYREGETDVEHWREWMCGSKYNELPIQEQSRWQLWEAEWNL